MHRNPNHPGSPIKLKPRNALTPQVLTKLRGAGVLGGAAMVVGGVGCGVAQAHW